MEQNKQMTADESLALISETLNNSRKDILRNSAKHYMLWGSLLVVFSLLVYLLWKTTENGAWNNLWFGMPLIGFLLGRQFLSKKDAATAENTITRICGGIWATFGIFACAVSLFSVLYTLINKENPLVSIFVFASLSSKIILLFGIAESICGVALKNWTIKIAGLLTGIGGLALYCIYIGDVEEQMLLFTFAGFILLATGVIINRQYR